MKSVLAIGVSPRGSRPRAAVMQRRAVRRTIPLRDIPPARYLKLPETQKRFEAEGVEAEIRTPAEVHRMMPIEIAKWKNVARVANIHVQ